VFLTAVILALSGAGAAHADGPTNSDALWQIVAGQCVPDDRQHGDPAPCAQVDLTAGQQHGYAVLKDIVGATQFLLIPTARIAGIESPELLAPDATNYFAAAWRARIFVEHRAGRALPRDSVSLAINSSTGRTQNQLHIHIDCVREDVRQALADHAREVSASWTPVTVLADGLAGARADMGSETLVVVGMGERGVGPDSRPGFIILADRADAATGNPGVGEQLQDHSCALLDR
jgi:CDP-diacylglycerol pyrophosphatase